MRPRGADDGTVLVQLAAGSTIGRQRGASQAFDCASTTVCSGALRSHNTAPTQAVNTHPPPITPVQVNKAMATRQAEWRVRR